MMLKVGHTLVGRNKGTFFPCDYLSGGVRLPLLSFRSKPAFALIAIGFRLRFSSFGGQAGGLN